MPVDARLWQEVWEACPWASAFASPLWHAATAEIEPTDASFEWRGIITPLRKVRLARGFVAGYESAVPGVPAGPIAKNAPTEETVQEYWQELDRRTKGRFLVHLRADSPFRTDKFKTLHLVSHVLRLEGREKNLSTHHARQLKKAGDIRVSPARREEDFDAYMEMYEASLERWKRRPARTYGRAFFERIRSLLLPADACRFFIAWSGERPQSAALVLYESRRAVYWHGVSVANPAPGAGHMLHWKIAEDAERRGLEFYDLGPSPGLEGVARFKRGFGALEESQITTVGPARMFSAYFLKRARR